MTSAHPEADCRDVWFAVPYALDAPAEVALEDYARVLLRARDAETLAGADGASVAGVHLCGVPPIPESAESDLEAFARDLQARGERGGGLGWS